MIALKPDVLMAAETRSQVMTNRIEYRFAPQGGQTQVTVGQKLHVRLGQAITIRLKGHAMSTADLGRMKAALEGA
jgi:hypothetical protein